MGFVGRSSASERTCPNRAVLVCRAFGLCVQLLPRSFTWPGLPKNRRKEVDPKGTEIEMIIFVEKTGLEKDRKKGLKQKKQHGRKFSSRKDQS